ncbi:Lrp/AsnC family transcriptional regulator [Microbacterium sp. NPDC056234]|uniref:Lrp/AsnC family transcriptional regulator n=1 Tax=Microbacterium sp. NPDC056234 TaxID=3345757 RepID=UPI0035D787B7
MPLLTELDATDRLILAELARNARLSLTDLAARVHLGVSAVRMRLRRLETEDVIAGYRTEIAPSVLGFALHAVVRMKIHGALFDQVDAVIATEPQITRCLRITGESCYHLEVLARDMQDLQRITTRLASVGSITTDLVYEVVAARPTPVSEHPTAPADHGSEPGRVQLS